VALSERFEAGPPDRKRPCVVCALIVSLPDNESQALRNMLASPRWSDTKTFKALKAEGHLTHLDTDQALGRHRRTCEDGS
jgi:hypothetical protein